MLMNIWIYWPEELLSSGKLGFKNAIGLGLFIYVILSPKRNEKVSNASQL